MSTRNIITGLIAAFCLLFSGIHPSVAQTTPDPGITGPLAVSKGEYNLGDLAFTTSSFPNPIEVRASVHYPTGLPGGPYPVIVYLHGRHSVCYNTSTMSVGSFTWPCPSGQASIESFQGYDYSARQMASYGYIVISISCNAINAADNPQPDRGMNARGELIQHHLDLWNTWNTTGGAPTTLGSASMWIGKVNLQKIGTMGHSRGGEGVIYHALYNQSLGSPYGVKAVLTLAPVDFFRRKLNGIAVMNVAPYCDGDVSDLQGVHFYDDVRYTDTLDQAPKYNVLMMGANHNFYNTVWTPSSGYVGGSDDWSSSDPFCRASTAGNGRFDTLKQKMAYKAYAAAFFRLHVGGEQQFAPILEAKDIIPPASSTLDTTNVFVSYHPSPIDRRDINRVDTILNETTNTMGSAVTTSGLLASGMCGGGVTILLCGVASQQAHEPHRGAITPTPIKGLAGMGMRWNDTTDWYMNDVPATQQDLTLVDAVQFRAGMRYNECTSGQTLNFTVQLIDSAGVVSNAVVRNFNKVLFYPPGTSSTLLPRVMYNTVRIPIDTFNGIDIKKVRKVKFLFNKAAAGSILVSDITFVNTHCGIMNGTFGYHYDTVGYDVQFYDTVVGNTGDTVTRLWNFGNPASGTNDTSSAHNPTHIFTGAGTYTVCLYSKAKRKNDWICTDTLCTTIKVVWPVLVPPSPAKVVESTITIIPNPARDYLQVNGAEKTDVLRLVNAMGQVVLTAQITEPVISLPSYIPSGVYYAIVTTGKGMVHKKIVITR